MTPYAKIVIRVERKPDPPGFVCGLCGAEREHWEAAYKSPDGAACLCNRCQMLMPRTTQRNYFRELGWEDAHTIFIARDLLAQLKQEADHG